MSSDNNECRKSHYIRINNSHDSPSNVLFVDTEAVINSSDTKQFQTFRLGYAIHSTKNKGKWFSKGYKLLTVEDFWKLLDKFNYPGKKLYIFAHNMAYDYTILKIDSYLSSRNIEINTRVIDSVFIINCEGIVFLSSTNYYRQSLRELGTIFGLEKMFIDDYKNVSDEKLMDYCIRDVQVLKLIMERHFNFLIDNNLGCFKKTIASQALTTYTHRFMNHKLLCHGNSDIIDMEKISYRGGRCEAFRLGKYEDIYYLDVNSMYPYVMKTKYYPIKPISSHIITNVDINEIKEIIKDNFVLATCKIKLKKPVIAVKKERLLFPVGNVIQTITSPEIEYIFENSDEAEIISFDKVVVYNREKIFSDYVDFFYKLKSSSSHNADRVMAKLMLNSLYGKFGQNTHSEIELVTDEKVISICNDIMSSSLSYEFLSNRGEKYIKLGDLIYNIKQSEGKIARDSIPIIASAVTAYSRMLLNKLIKTAGYKNVYYCDTDSIFVNIKGYNNLSNEIDENELGKLKVEKQGVCEIFGVKDYVFNGSPKLKGIKKSAIKIDEKTYSQSSFITKNKRYSLAIPDGTVIVEQIKKVISRKYLKGIVNGQTINPFIFQEF